MQSKSRPIIGTILSFGVLMLGMLLPMITVFGIAALIWGGKVFDGSLPKGSPQRYFVSFAVPAAMFVGANVSVNFFVLPILAVYGVRIRGKRDVKFIMSAAGRVKTISLRYAALMDKLISEDS